MCIRDRDQPETFLKMVGLVFLACATFLFRWFILRSVIRILLLPFRILFVYPFGLLKRLIGGKPETKKRDKKEKVTKKKGNTNGHSTTTSGTAAVPTNEEKKED